MATIADLLSAEVKIEVVTCPAPQAPVRWVAVNEQADPRPFLGDHELLLFTGLETKGWSAERWRRYVQDLRPARVAAIGLGMGHTHAEIPEPLSRACDEFGVNLLRIPVGTSFVSISQAVARILEAHDRAEANDAVALHRRLARAARQSDAVGAVAGELSKYVDGQVWVVGADGRVISQSAPNSDALNIIRDEVAHLLPRGLAASASWSIPDATTTVQPIGLREPPDAYLAVQTPASLGEYQRTAVLVSVSLLCLEFARRSEQQDSMRTLRRRAIELLLHSEVRAAELVLATIEPDRSHDRPQLAGTLRFMRIRGPHARLSSILRRAEDTAARYGGLTSIAQTGTEVHLLAPTPTSAAWIDALDVSDLPAGVGIGIGSPVDVMDLDRSFRTAGLAADRATAARPVVTWSEFGDSGLASLIPPDDLTAFAEDLLARLDNTDAGREELCRIAGSFIRHHGRIHAVADEVGLHRNTVRARLREAEAALGTDLGDPTSRLSLWAALQATPMQTELPRAH